MTEDQDMALPTARATAASQSNPSVSSKAGIANADSLDKFIRDWLSWQKEKASSVHAPEKE